MIPILNSTDNLERVLNRSQLNFDEINRTIKDIVNDVRLRGDSAVFEYTERFDNVKLTESNILVTSEEIKNAYKQVPQKTLSALRNAKKNIIEYHTRQLRADNIITSNGKTTGYVIRPVDSVGIYVPGGKASYPSSVLMCALPAVVAGVKEIVMCTPVGNQLNPLTIVAAAECGITKIYKIGGAQAIAAMAYGTKSIPKVNVISGPGNIYVALAKREVFGAVGVDMIAGPSEIMIVADSSANYRSIAADMLSQAEHDELALSLLVTDCKELALKVQSEVEVQLGKLPKVEIAGKALENYGTIVMVENIQKAIELVNKVAPEHLELSVNEPEKYLNSINNAGAVFMGHNSPEPLGDYYAGPNHVLPTSGTAKFFSCLGVDNYIKKISVINYSYEALKQAKDDIITLAETEGLQAHANSIKVRFEKE